MQTINTEEVEKEQGSPTFDVSKHARYVGRMDWSDERGPVLSWAGSSITVRFEGSAIALQMKITERNDTWLDLIVDGGEARKIHVDGLNDGIIEVAQDLDPTVVHTLEVYKRTEAMFGTVQFLGFTLPKGGQFLSPPAHLDRKIELIGDSISVGSGNEGKDGDPSIAEHENNNLAYGSIAAQALNAEIHTIAISGIGLAVNYGEERINTMLDQYERVNPLHSNKEWDFTQWIPDVVVINLGTNDNNYSTEEAEFLEKYEGFVARIRSRYPDAHIFLSLGPFNLMPTKERVLTVFGKLHQEGDNKVHYLMYEPANTARDGLGETGHPNTITHKHMSDDLIRQIKEQTGW